MHKRILQYLTLVFAKSFLIVCYIQFAIYIHTQKYIDIEWKFFCRISKTYGYTKNITAIHITIYVFHLSCMFE